MLKRIEDLVREERLADPEDKIHAAKLEVAKKRAGRLLAMFRGGNFKIHAFSSKRVVSEERCWWFAICGTSHLKDKNYRIYASAPKIEEASINDITCNRCRISLGLPKTKS